MSIKELYNRWNKDKIYFINKEIGELQDFVKDVLQDSELFGLNKGIGSTVNKNRKYEFTIETSKEGRRADFVIFINGDDVVIPVEVEKHNNIKKGIEQVFQYQKDWKKKYAILTDGNEWRFYRSNQYKTFLIENILQNPKDFLVYWQEYIKPENYYIDLFTPIGQQSMFILEKIDLNNPQNRKGFFDDITQVISNFKGKMSAIGAFDNLFNQKENEKTAVETSYAYLIQFILYKVLVDNGYRRFNDEFNRMLGKIQKALQDKDFYSIIINEIKNISEYISHYIYKPFAKEQESINKKLIENLRSELSIDDIAPWLDIILFINRYNFSGLKNEVFGFIYENFLKDLYQDKNKGQYFTDSAVVNFMLEEMGYTEKELRNKAKSQEISIIDPSCGAGTFLYSAVDKIINAFDNGTEAQSKYIESLIDKNIFGLDIEEFPLYLAEMNILMRLLPLIVNDDYENPIDNKLKIFKTKDSISEFLSIGLNSKIDEKIDLFGHLQKTALDYPSFMRDEKDLEAMLKSLQEVSGVRERFDFVIGNPPYIGYNECCKQEIEFTKKIKNKEDKSIIMSNVYGMNLNTVPNRRKPYSPKPNLYSFFVALGLGLLKENGKLCYIIPQTILTAGDLDVLRYHLAKFTTIEKIITFDGNMFVGRGLKQNKPVATSSLIFVLNKNIPQKDHYVKVLNYSSYDDNKGIDFVDYISKRGNEVKEILQSDLINNVANWNFLKQDENFINMYEDYKKNSISIEEYRRFVLNSYDEICLDGGLKLNETSIKNFETIDSFKVFNPKINNYCKYKATKTNLFYDKKADINFIPGGQGMKAFENKYKIIWKTRFNNKFQFTDEDNLILNGNQSLLISSNNLQETLFLFSMMNSNIVLYILAKMSKLPNESAYIIALTGIKEFVRIPKITDGNQHIKTEIIKQTQNLFDLEDFQLKDFVEFTTSKQKFTKVYVEDNNLILIDQSGGETKQKIKKNPALVNYLIADKFPKKLFSEDIEISLQTLKYLEATDQTEQTMIKDYIDNLVFALYFDIQLREIDVRLAEKIKEICKSHKFYKMIFATNSVIN